MRSTRKMRGGMPARWGPSSLRTQPLQPMSRASPLPKSKKRKERRALERPSGPSHGPRNSEIGTKQGKRRRLGDEPLHVARLSRAYSEGGYHVYMTAELNSKLDAQLKDDLKGVEGDLGTLPGIAALKDGGVFTKHIGTSINISRPGKLGKIAGLTLASVGAALLNAVQTKAQEKVSAANWHPPRSTSKVQNVRAYTERVAKLYQKGVETISDAYTLVTSKIVEPEPLDPAVIEDHHSAWNDFTKSIGVFLTPSMHMEEEEHMTRLIQLEEIIDNFNRRYGASAGASIGEQNHRFNTWNDLITEINELKVRLKIPLHKHSSGKLKKKKKKKKTTEKKKKKKKKKKTKKNK